MHPWMTESRGGSGGAGQDILPTLFGGGYSAYQAHPTNYLLSFLLHVLAAVLLLTSGMLVTGHNEPMQRRVAGFMTDIAPLVLPASARESHGGGGGGDHDPRPASHGLLPSFAREQFAPPTVDSRNLDPKLTMEATLIGPEIRLPQNGQMGDPASLFAVLSNGAGSNSGIGNGSNHGVGPGNGPGYGPGSGAGCCGGAFVVGGGVTAPRPLFSPDPEYSEEARKAKHQGTVLLWVVIGPDGRVHNMRVQRSLGMGLDAKAMEAVKTWKFVPAHLNEQPVAVQVYIEVNFRLY